MLRMFLLVALLLFPVADARHVHELPKRKYKLTQVPATRLRIAREWLQEQPATPRNRVPVEVLTQICDELQ